MTQKQKKTKEENNEKTKKQKKKNRKENSEKKYIEHRARIEPIRSKVCRQSIK